MPDSSYSTKQHNVLKNDLIAPLIKEQFPDFFKEDESQLPLFLERYYEYMECIQIHYTDRILNEYRLLHEDVAVDGILLEDDADLKDTLILESLRTDDSTFETGEIVTGQTSGAKGVVRGVQEKGEIAGKHTMTDPHHIFVLTTEGKFATGEKIIGSANRVTATIGSIDDKGATGLSREMLNIADVSNTDEEFLEILRKEFIPNIPKTAKTNLKKLIPLAKDIYKNRGNENSFKFLWRSVYDQEDLEFLYPKDYIFKVSGSKWSADTILFCNRATSTNAGSFSGRKITGSSSFATAVVQRISGYVRGQYDLVQLFLTDVNGTFITGETVVSDVTEDGITARAITIASLKNITVEDGGTSYKVGDVLSISGGGGIGAEAVVNTVTDGAVNEIVISDGGDGYLGTEEFTYFTSEGDTGTGASSKATGFIQSGAAKVYGNNITVSSFSSTNIGTGDYGGDLSGHNANTHFHSNANNTFDITVGSSANYAVGQFVCDSANNIIGTVIAVPDATSIIYALEDDTKPNFYPGTNGSSISAYLSDGSAVASTTTTVTAVTAVSDSQYFGALTLQEIPYGTLTSTEVVTVGRDFQQAPSITASQNAITVFNNDDGVLGPRTRFLNLASNTQFLFSVGRQVQGQTSGAAGTILDPYIDSLGNSSFSALRFKPDSVEIVVDSTDGSADAGDNLLLEDGFHPSHGSYSGTTSFNGRFRLEDLDFAPNESILQLGTTANAVTASSNVVSIDNSLRGNSAIIQSGNLSIGSITSVKITDFGVGYLAAPNISATTTGDGNAILSSEVGSVVEKPGQYTSEDSLLSGKDKIQDSYYYQDYSYVLKTDLPVKTFKDTVKSFVHPAGWALFGEISVVNEVPTTVDFDAERPFTLVLNIPPFSVNFLDANANITEYHITFIEGIASISFTPVYDNEFVYRFKESDPIDASIDTGSTAVEHIEYELVENVSHQGTVREPEYTFELVRDVSYQNFVSDFNYEKYLDLDVAPIPSPSSDAFPELEFDVLVNIGTPSSTTTTDLEVEALLNAAIQNVVDEIHFEKFLVNQVQMTIPSSVQEKQYETERTADVTHSVSPERELETQSTLAAQASVAMTRQVWEKIGTSAFAEADSPVIRTMPTIQDWYNTYQKPSEAQTVTIETLYNQQINMLAGPQYAPKVKEGDEIFIPSIDSVLENNGKLLLTGPVSQDAVEASEGTASMDFTGVSSVDIGTSSGDTADDICLAYGNGVYVAMDDRKLYSSTDGSTWTERLDFTDSSITLGNRKVDYSGDTFYAVATDKIYKSTNGTTWTSIFSGTTYLTTITSDGNSTESSRKIMGAGVVGAIRKSDDGGSTWTGGLGQDGTYSSQWYVIAYGEQSGTDYWVVANWTGSSPSAQHKLWYSDDFWSTKTSRTNVLSDFIIRGVCYTGTNWICVGMDGAFDDGKIAVGSDITGTFTDKTPSGVLTGQGLYNVKMYGGHVFAVGENVILVSKDHGNNWTTLDDNSNLASETIKDAAWTGTSNVAGNFVATGLDQYTIAPKYDSGTIAAQDAVEGDDGDDILLEDGMSPLDVLTAQSLEAAETLVTGDIVIQNANGTVSKANTTNITSSNFKGIVNGSFSATQTASVLGNGFTTHVTSRTLTVDATHYVTGTSPFFSTTPGTPSVVLGKGVANNGVTSTYTAGENLTNGDFVMLNGSNQAVKLDMTAATTTVQSDVHEFPFIDGANTYATSISIDKNSSNTTSGTFGITYIDNSSGYRQKLRLATYSGTPTDIDITYGTEVDLGSGGIEDFMDMQFSETTGKFLHICNETIRGGYYSGTTPTLGTAMTVTAYKPACDPNPNDGDQWLYARQDSSTGKVSIITMGSGATTTSLTQGTEVEYDTGNSSRTAKIEWDPHTSGRFVITWRRSNEGGDMYTRIGSVSGTTITWDGSIYEVGSTNGTENYEMHWDPKQSNQILYTYNDKDGYNYPPRVRVGTVGSGGAITFGTETLLYDDPNDTGDEGVNHVRAEFFQDTGKIMFVVASSVTASKGYYLFGQLSNSGTLTLDTSVTQFSTDYIYHTDMDSVGSLILTSFEDGNTYGGASGDDGSYVFAATDVASFDSSDFIGVVDADYTSGATATVQGMGMTDDAQSGLDGSSIYYFTSASPAGLSTSGTVIAGKAVSATEIRIGDPTKTNSVLIGGEVVEEYSGTTSNHGFLLTESDRLVYEDNTSLNRKGIPYWQKEEAKYIVKSSNSTSFTVGGAGHSNYLPVGLHDFNTEAYVLRNRS